MLHAISIIQGFHVRFEFQIGKTYLGSAAKEKRWAGDFYGLPLGLRHNLRITEPKAR